MDSKLYFVSSIVVIELIRLFRIRPTDTNSHALKKQQVATVTELTDKEIAAQAEDKQVSDLVTALRVVPHPEGRSDNSYCTVYSNIRTYICPSSLYTHPLALSSVHSYYMM